MPSNRSALSKYLASSTIIVAVVVSLCIVAWTIQGTADELAQRARLSELGVLATLDGTGRQIASVNCSTIKDAGDFDEAFEIILELHAPTSLNLDGMPVTNSDLERIGKLSSLASLSVSDCDIGGQGLDWLSGLKNLETLHLSRTQVADGDLESVGSLYNLTAIDLSGCKVRRDLTPLASLPKLKLLVLSQVSLDNGALAGLAEAPSLSRVSLAGAEYAENDLQALKSAMPALVVDN